ncbi:hypothetical protein H0H87_007686 [Tephrocybe sp. NHM501043]|nr:hypothetical protein H0H87_007686 [Tephrocybe sp. NHM501043]
MQKLNSLLHETPSHFKLAALCEQLEAKMDAPLHQKYIKKKLQEARIDQNKATCTHMSKPASKSLLSSTIAAVNMSSWEETTASAAQSVAAVLPVSPIAAVYCLDDDEPDDVEELNVIAAILDHIEQLASEETLLNFDKAMKDEFRAIFKPIANVKHLP